MSLATQARAVERDIFGALIGTLLGVLVCRIALLVIDVNVYALVALLGIGAWSGGFVVHLGAGKSELAVRSLQVWALQFRQICLRVMLWLLGAAAVLGVLSVLTASYDVVGRIAGTAAVTAIATGLLWPFTVMIDRERFRAAGLFGAASVIVVYVLVTPAIWELGNRGEETALTGLIIALMTPAGLIVVGMMQTRLSRLAGLVGIGLYVCVLTLFLIALWYPHNWYSSEKWWETGFALGGFGVLAMLCLVGAATGDRRYWRWAGVLAAMISFALCVFDIWKYMDVTEGVLVTVASVAVAIAHANVTLFIPLKGAQIWLRIATICTVALTAFFLDIDLLFSLSRGPGISVVGRLALASAILASCGTLALVIIARLNRTVQHPSEPGPCTSITVFCPKCGKRQTLPLEQASCSSCGLGIYIRVDEPPAAQNEPPEKGDPFHRTGP